MRILKKNLSLSARMVKQSLLITGGKVYYTKLFILFLYNSFGSLLVCLETCTSNTLL